MVLLLLLVFGSGVLLSVLYRLMKVRLCVMVVLVRLIVDWVSVS